MAERIVFESRPKVRKVDSDEGEGDSESYNRSDGKPVHVDIDKVITKGHKPTLALLRNRSEKNEINNNGETRYRDGKINLHRSSRIFKPPERLGSVPYF